MPKLHQNLFYYYRGLHSNPRDVETQLENNTTKALVNVLEKCNLETAKELLSILVGFSIAKNSKKIHFTLQESSIGKERINNFSERVVLGISPHGRIKKTKRATKGLGIPDAWIWGNDFVIVIENKTRGHLYSSQINRYRELVSTSRCIAKSWINDIHPSMKEFLNSNRKNLGRKDRLLIEEFVRYLEMIELAKFQGFEKQDFTRRYSEDADERNYFLNKLEKLASSVIQELRPWGLKHSIGKGKTWHGFYRDYKDKSCFELAHFSIYEEDGVGVKLHIGSGPDLSRLKKKIHDSKFMRLILNLKNSHRQYEIAVSETEYVRPFKTDWAVSTTLYSNWLNDERVSRLVQIISNTRKMWFSIYYKIDPSKAEILGEDITNEIIQTIIELQGIYDFIIK
jgi:hypothetical protein